MDELDFTGALVSIWQEYLVSPLQNRCRLIRVQ